MNGEVKLKLGSDVKFKLKPCRKNALIRKIRLISKFICYDDTKFKILVKQTIAIHILSNISRIKSNKPMKLDQLIEYTNRNIFIQNLCRK